MDVLVIDYNRTVKIEMKNKIEFILRIKRPNIIRHADVYHKFNRLNINRHRKEKVEVNGGRFGEQKPKDFAATYWIRILEKAAKKKENPNILERENF